MLTHIQQMLVVFFATIYMTGIASCKKLVAIPPPVNSVTTSQVFSTDQEATEAMSGVYYNMMHGGATFSEGMTIYPGASADELVFFSRNNTGNIQFQENQLLPNNLNVIGFWNQTYATIYGCNAVIAGTQSSVSIHDSVKNELAGEAEFVRGLSYFYLVNLFGEVPLVTTTDYNKTSLLPRTAINAIYSAIVSDLKDAQMRLAADYSVGQNQRIVPNRWAAMALLARVYLYTGDWTDAANQATSVLANTSLYQLAPGLGNVFSANSTEAIWQLQLATQISPYNATPEGFYFIPNSPTAPPPNMYLNATLLGSFEASDQRRTQWIDSTKYLGKVYYYPYKYTIGGGNAVPNGAATQYYTVLRLAEQYLIRAEAEAKGASGGITAAIADLNTIRNRAGLANYSGTAIQDSVLTSIYHECQVEFFAEWGHRWMDLKRWGLASSVLSANKGILVTANALWYPIPINELQTDPNLTQNAGYN